MKEMSNERRKIQGIRDKEKAVVQKRRSPIEKEMEKEYCTLRFDHG